MTTARLDLIKATSGVKIGCFSPNRGRQDGEQSEIDRQPSSVLCHLQGTLNMDADSKISCAGEQVMSTAGTMSTRLE